MQTARVEGQVEVVEELTFNRFNPVTESVQRVRVDGETLIRKTIRPDGEAGYRGWPSGPTVDHWNWWRREADLYASDLAGWVHPGMRLPRLLRSVQLTDGRVELWLEDVTGRPGVEMSTEEAGRLAHAWGATQARATGRPPEPWLARSWLPSFLAHRPVTSAAFEDEQAWAHPDVAAVIDAPLRRGLARLWEQRAWCCERLATLPHTVTHHDLWPGNVIVPDDGVPVLVDWAMAGWSPVGLDVPVMVFDTFLDLLVDVERLDEVERAVTSRWLDGVSERIDPDVALAGMHLSAVRFAWLPAKMIAELGGGRFGNVYLPDGVSTADEWAARAPVFERMVQWFEKARSRYRGDRSTHPPGA